MAKGRREKNRSSMCIYFGQALQQTLKQTTKVDSATARSIRSCRSALGGRFAPTLLNSAGRLPQAVINVASHRLCCRGLQQGLRYADFSGRLCGGRNLDPGYRMLLQCRQVGSSAFGAVWLTSDMGAATVTAQTSTLLH